MINKQRLPQLLVYIAACTGVLYGYNIGVTAGLIIFLKHHFLISTTNTSLLVGSFLSGVFILLLIMPKIHTNFSRKHILIIATLLSMLGTAAMIIPQQIVFIIIARFIMGISSGMITATAPLYIVEAIPCSQRGRGTVTFQLSLCFGILAASLFTLLLAHSYNWIILALCELPFSICLFIALMMIYPSPRWLISKGRKKESLAVLLATHSISEAKQLYKILKEATGASNAGYLNVSLFKKYMKPIILTVMLCALNQLVGINVILQYDASILVNAGFEKHNLAFLGSVFVTSVNFVITLIAFYIADKFERKYILRVGLAGVFLSLLLISLLDMILIDSHLKAILTTIILSVFIICFAVAPGSLVWGVAAEILPSNIRSSVQPIALSLGSLCGAILSFSYVYLAHTIGLQGVFLIFALFALTYFILTFFLPKTTNTILENIHTNHNETEQ